MHISRIKSNELLTATRRSDDGWEVQLGIDRAEPRDVPAIMIERALSPAADNLSRDPRWALVYRDDTVAVFFPVGIVGHHENLRLRSSAHQN